MVTITGLVLGNVPVLMRLPDYLDVVGEPLVQASDFAPQGASATAEEGRQKAQSSVAGQGIAGVQERLARRLPCGAALLT